MPPATSKGPFSRSSAIYMSVGKDGWIEEMNRLNMQ